jgi:hypothetical protein
VSYGIKKYGLGIFVYVKRIGNPRCAVRYLLKYLTKSLSSSGCDVVASGLVLNMTKASLGCKQGVGYQ